MVRIIKISKDYEGILPFLFPDYSISDSAAMVDSFITHRDIKTQREKDLVKLNHTNAVFISNVLFEEIWDLDKIAEECVKFVKAHHLHRKTKCVLDDKTFLRDAVTFLFDLPKVEEDDDINRLFDSIGSAAFTGTFLTLSTTRPLSSLIAAVLTFTLKVHPESVSTYYKRKATTLYPRIQRNMQKALEGYYARPQDPHGLSFCKLVQDIYAQ